MTAVVLAILSLLLLFPVAGFCAGNVKSELQGIKKEIQQKKLLIKTTAAVEKKVSGELAQIEKSLKEKEDNLKHLTGDLKGVEASLGQTGAEAERVRREAERKQDEIRRRLVGLYKAGDMGAARVYFSSGSLPQMQESMRYMQAVLQNDHKIIDEYKQKIAELRILKEKLERDAAKKERIKESIEAKRQEIEEERRKKGDYLAHVRHDKQSYQASLQQLEVNARRLQSMVEKLEAQSRKRYTAKPDKIKGKSQHQHVEVVSYSGKGLGSQRGQLALPVHGEITSRFGKHKHPEFDSWTVSNGISIAAPSGTDIHSIADGKVIFANYFKGYGNMVIVDHGEGYFSLYAHASKILKKEGATVTKNETVASVGDVDSPHGSMLYFEIRYQGKPVDPGQWFR